MAYTWFKFHTRARHSRRVCALNARAFRSWVMFMSLASEGDGKITKDIKYLGFELRQRPSYVAIDIQRLVSVGLLEDCGDHFKPSRWDEMQARPASPAERMRNYRLRQRNASVTCDAVDSEEDSDIDKKEVRSKTAPLRRATKPRTQIGEWGPSEALRNEARRFWESKGRNDLGGADQVERFRDFHLSKGSLMADWNAAWRTWYKNAVQFTRLGNGTGKRPPTAHDKFFAAAASLIRDDLRAAEGGDDSGTVISIGRALLSA